MTITYKVFPDSPLAAALPIPADMLRYDRATVIDESTEHDWPVFHLESDVRPTFARWLSFGWIVQTTSIRS